MTKGLHKSLVEKAIVEDLPSGDLTTDLLELGQNQARALIVAKEDLVLCGRPLVDETYQQISDQIEIKWHFAEGDFVLAKQCLASVKGPANAILKGERVALNFLGRLSGIASLTRCFVKEVAHTKCKILDTRKTTPGLRQIEKYAVQIGGAMNHRMNLSEAILVKENHVAAVGDMTECLRRIRDRSKLPIEVEVRNLTELQIALKANAERILLDNMSDSQLIEALSYIPEEVFVEASGGMVLERVKTVAETGVDFISVGALTHSAPCADISLLIQKD